MSATTHGGSLPLSDGRDIPRHPHTPLDRGTEEPLYTGLLYTGPLSIPVKFPVRKPQPTVDEGVRYTGPLSIPVDMSCSIGDQYREGLL